MIISTIIPAESPVLKLLLTPLSQPQPKHPKSETRTFTIGLQVGLSHDILTQPLNVLKLIGTPEGKSLIPLACTWSVTDQGSTFPGQGSISNLRPLSGT